MSAKDCGHHGSYWGDYWGERKYWRRFCGCLLFILIIAGIVILLVWLILRPSKPSFTLQSFSVPNLTLSNYDQSYNYTVLTATLQLTLSSHNPNSRIGVYYDRLHTFASYSNQQITASTTLPSTYLSSGDAVIWAPYITTPTGGTVLAPSLGNALAQDQQAGVLLLHVQATGRLRWKVGTWVSGGYHLDVSCPAYLYTDGKGSGLQFRQISGCTVDI